MTQNTQTIAEKIKRMIENAAVLDSFGVLEDGSFDSVSKVIAAEIDALKADNAQANQWLVNGVAKIEEIEKQRDEALRRLKGSMEITEGAQNRRRDEIEANAKHSKRIEELEAQLAEARAEVERLRLPAKAWETLEAFREAGRTGTEEDEDAARSAHKAARDRAREAAKERKP